MTETSVKVCVNLQENGICEIAEMPCNKVFMCSSESMWIDKEDENEYKNRNKI